MLTMTRLCSLRSPAKRHRHSDIEGLKLGRSAVRLGVHDLATLGYTGFQGQSNLSVGSNSVVILLAGNLESWLCALRSHSTAHKLQQSRKMLSDVEHV